MDLGTQNLNLRTEESNPCTSETKPEKQRGFIFRAQWLNGERSVETVLDPEQSAWHLIGLFRSPGEGSTSLHIYTFDPGEVHMGEQLCGVFHTDQISLRKTIEKVTHTACFFIELSGQALTLWVQWEQKHCWASPESPGRRIFQGSKRPGSPSPTFWLAVPSYYSPTLTLLVYCHSNYLYKIPVITKTGKVPPKEKIKIK